MFYLISHSVHRPTRSNTSYTLYNDYHNTYVSGCSSIDKAIEAIKYSPLNGYESITDFLEHIRVYENNVVVIATSEVLFNQDSHPEFFI